MTFLFALPGLAMALFGAWLMLPTAVRKSRLTRTEGRIVATSTRDTPRNVEGPSSTLYYATVEFTALDGQPVQTRWQNPMSFKPGKPGDPVVVFYDPRDPRRISVENGMTRISCRIAGAFFIIVGLFYMGLLTAFLF